MYFNHDLGGVRRVESKPVAKITIDPKPCMTNYAAGEATKSDRSLGDCCLCQQHMFKDQPWLLRVSGETKSAAQNSRGPISHLFPKDHNGISFTPL